MKKLFTFFTILLIFTTLSETLSAQSGTKLMLAEDSMIYLQSEPILEGIDLFNERLNKVREEEGREPLGLVMCGGSARAYSHIGAIKAMEENNVRPDFIVANSMGAIIGMFYAYGFSTDKILEILSQISLTQYFEPVLPIHGGLISTRKFKSFVQDLIGNPDADLTECPIPIIVLSEDLYSKRQIWHACGNFSEVILAAFAMPAMIEPAHYTLTEEKQTKTLLIDGACIDFGGVTVAETFSNNIIVSTALYEKDLNFRNIFVNLNRTISIGKERSLSRDMKIFKPVLIRNEVEQISFMSFDKLDYITNIGYDCANKVMEEILACPHGFKDLSERYKITDKYADNAIRNVHTNEPLNVDKNYFGLKIWPVFPVTDFQDYSLYNKTTLSAFAFDEIGGFYTKAGVSVPFNFKQLNTETLLRFNPTSVFDSSIFASYSFNLKTFQPEEFYGAATIKIRPEFFPYAFRSLFVTGEYNTEADFSLKDSLFKAGFELQTGNAQKIFFALKPYYYLSGNNFSTLSNGAGANSEFLLTTNIFTKETKRFAAGISDSFSTHYSFYALGNATPQTKLYKSDYFRAPKPEDNSPYIISNSTELFFTDFFPELTAMELFIMQQYKFGAFFDYAYTTKPAYCTGAFFRTQISLIGLCSYIFDSSCGWNFDSDKFFFNFEMKARM